MSAELKVMRSMSRLKRVWIVDDDREYRAALGDLLESHGFPVMELADGREALDALVSGTAPPPSLLILDVVMPRLGGLEFLTIAKGYYRLTSIPVLVVSAHDHPTALRPDSVSGYLRKPHAPEELLSAVRSIMESDPGAGSKRGLH